MQFFAQVPKIIPISALMTIFLSGFLSGCTNAPLSECDSLIAVLKQGNDVLKNIDLNDGEAVEQKANALSQISQELQKLEVANKRLQEFRNDFVKVYQTYSHAFTQTHEAIAVVNNPLPAEVTVAQVQQAKLKVDRSSLSVNQASQQAELLSKRINDYCPVSLR